MPIEYQTITVPQFLKLGAHGKIDWRQSRAILAQLARSCAEKEHGRALLDVRDATSDLTAKQLESLVLTFRDAGFRDKHKLAVLHKMGSAPRSRLFIANARQQGWQARGFEEFEEAVAWLVIADATDAEIHVRRPERSRPALPPEDDDGAGGRGATGSP